MRYTPIAQQERKDAERYRKLRAWMLDAKRPVFGVDSPEGLDAAVDALPEPVSLEQELIDSKEPSRGYESGRDA